MVVKLSVESAPPPIFEPQPEIYILLHTSTKKAVGDMSGVPLPVPIRVDLKRFVNELFKTDTN